MSAAIDGIDHVLLGVRDLQAARRAFQLLGFTVSPRGRHIGWGTANYCVMFPESYVELLGIIDPAQFTNNLDKFLETREGLLGVAFASVNAEAAAKDLKERGVETGETSDLGRILELHEGDVEPAFRLLHLPAKSTPGTPAFVCQHLTPELVWQSPWLDHANGVCGLVSVTGVVENPGEVALAYGAIFGEDRVWADQGLVEVDTGRGRLRFTQPEGLSQLFPGLSGLPRFDPPWLAGLRLEVRDLNSTAGYLDAAGVRYSRDADSLLRVGPDYTCGAVVEFVAV